MIGQVTDDWKMIVRMIMWYVDPFALVPNLSLVKELGPDGLPCNTEFRVQSPE